MQTSEGWIGGTDDVKVASLVVYIETMYIQVLCDVQNHNFKKLYKNIPMKRFSKDLPYLKLL